MFGLIEKAIEKVLLALITVYQRLVSPLFPPSCRFYPSCSEYARQSLTKYGPLKGGWRSLLRLLKCHPFHPGGVDLP